MTWLYWGQPGQPPRGLVRADQADHVFADLAEGERVVATDVAADYTISDDGHSLVPVPVPLDRAKELRWLAVKALRDSHADGGCAVAQIGRFDTDLVSRSNINGAVTAAILAAAAEQPLTIDWKLADNTILALDGAALITVGQAVLAHVAACHATSQALGLAIDGAADEAALGAIDIEQGWPT